MTTVRIAQSAADGDESGTTSESDPRALGDARAALLQKQVAARVRTDRVAAGQPPDRLALPSATALAEERRVTDGSETTTVAAATRDDATLDADAAEGSG